MASAIRYEIDVEREFAARHAVQIGAGAWESSHEHAWRVVVTLSALSLDERGFVMDFLDVGRQLDDVLTTLNDADLNAVAGLGPQATAEAVARWIFDAISERVSASRGPAVAVASVTVHEAPGCRARVVAASYDVR
jgi:6-pyruvoyltetrahydropterin/6-carboxytetrahydropterin synthase